MSRESIEVAHRALAAWNDRDVEAMLALTDPEVEYVNSPTAVEPGTSWGHESFEDVLRAQWEILSDGRWEVDRIYERRDEERVLLGLRFENAKVTRVEVLGFGQAEVQAALEPLELSE